MDGRHGPRLWCGACGPGAGVCPRAPAALRGILSTGNTGAGRSPRSARPAHRIKAVRRGMSEPPFPSVQLNCPGLILQEATAQTEAEPTLLRSATELPPTPMATARQVDETRRRHSSDVITPPSTGAVNITKLCKILRREVAGGSREGSAPGAAPVPRVAVFRLPRGQNLRRIAGELRNPCALLDKGRISLRSGATDGLSGASSTHTAP